MHIAIIGTGNVGGTLAKRFADVGHTIYLGVRDTQNFKGKELENGSTITAHKVAEAVQNAEVVIVAVPAQAVPDAAKELGDVAQKVIIDTSNTVMVKPDGFENGFEALLALTNTKNIVKGFNTTGAENMANPMMKNIRIDMFVAGDSQKGKDIVTQLAKEIGFEEVYDFGGNDKVALLEKFATAWINLAIIQKYGRDIAFKVLKR